MTIKELEERTGLPRASVRFYETEGLIAPARLPNGYRDYSEEDARTLEKIKLLRELHLDLDSIKLVQRGELPLDRALFNLTSRLEGEKAALDKAAQVCRELERSGVGYAALEPRPWLDRLDVPARPAVEPPPPIGQDWAEPDDTDYARYHPWRRWLARGVDVGFWSLAIYAVLGLAFHVNLFDLPSWATAANSIASLALSLLTEPFLLHFWGWTPGKWIFGLKARSKEDGGRLSLEDARARTWGVFAQGYGYSIPVYSLWRLWKNYKLCQEGDDPPWDFENRVRYTREARRLDWPLWLGAEAVQIFLMILIALSGWMPPNRGELTVAQFCENYNYYADWLGVDGMRLDPGGAWIEDEEEPGVAVIYFGGSPEDWTYANRFEVEDGAVRAVTLSQSYEGPQTVLYIGHTRYQLATLALTGADKRFNPFNFGSDRWASLWEDQYGPFELDHRGYHISQTVEAEGFDGALPPVMAPVQSGHGQTGFEQAGDEQTGGCSYTRTATISCIGSD